jgi:hypothetical protein
MYSIAKFGSTAMQENDLYSDSDLLVVCPETHRKKLHKKYTMHGYSVTLLSQSQLEYMQNKGSLFIQHLKRDAKIVVDDDCKLRRFLDRCDFIPPDNAEILRCENTIQYIASLPNTSITSAWKADFLYCVSRDYLVKQLARENILAFGFNDIFRESTVKFNLNEADFLNLSKLRTAKARYRDTSIVYSDSGDASSEWISPICKAFSIDIEISKSWDFTSIVRRNFSSIYEKLRTLEFLYLIARSTGYIHSDHELIIKYICNPNLYGSSRKNNDDTLSRYILDIHRGIANKAMHWTASPLHFASLQSCQ